LCLVVIGVIAHRVLDRGRAEIVREHYERLCLTCGAELDSTTFSFLGFECNDQRFHITAVSRILDPTNRCTHPAPFSAANFKSSIKGICWTFRPWSFRSVNSEDSDVALENLGKNATVLGALEELARSDETLAKEKWRFKNWLVG
jgi:hypothetical protein